MDLPDKAAMDGGRTGTGRWQVAWATQVGAMHVARDQLREDAASVHVGDGIVIAAVSDGHGMARSFRAHVGSELAVEAARDVALASRPQWSGPGVDNVTAAVWLREHYTQAVLGRWRALVLDDVAEDPLSEQERRIAPDEASVLVAYGATLLVALVDEQRVLAWQIGDGDLVLAPAGATAGPAVAIDPHLVGNRTTSLCQPDAQRHVRTAVHELGPEACVVVLATDGFANAMLEGDWQERLGEDLHGLVTDHGFGAVAGKLPEWAAEASKASGDDVSLVVLAAAEHLGARAITPPAAGPGPRPGPQAGPGAVRPGSVGGPVSLPVAVPAAGVAGPGVSAAVEAPSVGAPGAPGVGAPSVGAPGVGGPEVGPSGASRRWLMVGVLAALVVLAVVAWVLSVRSAPGGVVGPGTISTVTTTAPQTGSSAGPVPTDEPPRGTLVPTATQSEPTITETGPRTQTRR